MAQAQPKMPVEHGAPDPMQYMHPLMKKHYGKWVYHSHPKPGVLMVPATLRLPKSARAAFIRAVAAHPPFSSKSVRRSSFSQTSAHLASPSS